ncbi:hypothetical protein FQA39_LY05605 [Lamprigera yunnana]|nr:hypothetical protein FQA39_LY05605 [Lamprigera yunnana]
MKIIWKSLTGSKKLYQYAASISGMMIGLSVGLNYSWTSPYVPFLLSENSTIPINNEQSLWVATIYLIGGVCGSTISGLALDVIGRRTILMISLAPFFIGWMLIVFATNLAGLLVARSLVGFADGITYGSTQVYLSEILDKDVRGVVCSFITISFLIGILLINVIGTYMTMQDSAIVGIAIVIIALLSLVWTPESPHYLLLKDRKEDARRSLIILRRVHDVDDELQLIDETVQSERSGNFLDLFRSKVQRNSLLIVLGLRATQMFSGVLVFIIYIQMLFESSTETISPLVSTVILYSIQIIVSLVSSNIVDKIGRRPLMIVSTAIVSVSLFGLGTYFYLRDYNYINKTSLEWFPLFGLVVSSIAFSIGLQMIPLFIVGELFASNVKAKGTAISDIACFIFAYLASEYFQRTAAYGLFVPMYTFGCCTSIGLIMTIWKLPETRNKTLQEIQGELKKNQK